MCIGGCESGSSGVIAVVIVVSIFILLLFMCYIYVRRARAIRQRQPDNGRIGIGSEFHQGRWSVVLSRELSVYRSHDLDNRLSILLQRQRDIFMTHGSGNGECGDRSHGDDTFRLPHPSYTPPAPPPYTESGTDQHDTSDFGGTKSYATNDQAYTSPPPYPNTSPREPPPAYSVL